MLCCDARELRAQTWAHSLLGSLHGYAGRRVRKSPSPVPRGSLRRIAGEPSTPHVKDVGVADAARAHRTMNWQPCANTSDWPGIPGRQTLAR
jgi:hypothetical protein